MAEDSRNSGAANGPLAAYHARIAQGLLQGDAEQERIAMRLEALQIQMAAMPKNGGWLSFLRPSKQGPQGLYIYGPVGRGKSMLMDLFFAHAAENKKRRVHFHAFMQEIHGAIFHYRNDPRTRNAGDPVRAVAMAESARTRLLCFDEFQVLDAADAMILARLFETLWDAGVVTVITSNRPPEDLYKHGLNRPLFLPFIAAIAARLEILALTGGTDYRRNRIKGRKTWIVTDKDQPKDEMDALFAALTEEAIAEATSFDIHGRQLVVPQQAKGVARFSFDALCRAALGPADYLTIAANFHTLMIDNVPRLGPAERNEAKRFVTLIDAIYETRAKLVASAAAQPQDLYGEGDGQFEFERTVSRLEEMQSEDYWRQPHQAVNLIEP